MGKRKPKSERVTPLGGEVSVPRDLGDDQAELTRQCRELFLRSVEKRCTWVLESLRSPSKDRTTDEGTVQKILDAVVDSWPDLADRFGFSLPTWLAMAFVKTVNYWKSRGLEDPLVFHEGTACLDGLMPARAVSSKDWRHPWFADDPPPTARAFTGDYRRVDGYLQLDQEPFRSLLKDGWRVSATYQSDKKAVYTMLWRKAAPLSISLPAFEPATERFSTWRARCDVDFKKAIEAHRIERLRGSLHVSRFIQPSHFDWAALYVFGAGPKEARGETAERIGGLEGKQRQTINSAVNKLLRVLEINLPERRGRHKGIKEIAPRHLSD